MNEYVNKRNKKKYLEKKDLIKGIYSWDKQLTLMCVNLFIPQ